MQYIRFVLAPRSGSVPDHYGINAEEAVIADSLFYVYIEM